MPGILLSEVFFSLDLVNLVYNNNNNIVKTAVKMVVDMLLLHRKLRESSELACQESNLLPEAIEPKTDQRLVLLNQLLQLLAATV